MIEHVGVNGAGRTEEEVHDKSVGGGRYSEVKQCSSFWKQGVEVGGGKVLDHRLHCPPVVCLGRDHDGRETKHVGLVHRGLKERSESFNEKRVAFSRCKMQTGVSSFVLETNVCAILQQHLADLD